MLQYLTFSILLSANQVLISNKYDLLQSLFLSLFYLWFLQVSFDSFQVLVLQLVFPHE